MKNYYQDDPEDSDKEILAEVKIYVDNNGEIGFHCGWEPEEMGVHSIASIFFGLAYNDLPEQILNDLKTQCVLDGNEEDFFRMVESIKAFIIDKNNRELIADGADESLVVTPRGIIRL